MNRLLLQLLVASSLLALSACSPSNSTPSGNPASGGKIKIENWPNQTGKIKVQLGGGNTAGDIGETAVAADGTATYSLPNPPTAYLLSAVDSFMQIGCTNTLSVSPNDAKLTRSNPFIAYLGTSTSVAGTVMMGTGQPTSFLGPKGFKFTQLVFADKEVSVTGTVTCSTRPNYSVNASLKSGWNFMVFEVADTNSSGFVTKFNLTSSSTEPSGFKWYFVPNPV